MIDDAVLLLGVFILIILFAGTPDIHDAIMASLSECK